MRPLGVARRRGARAARASARRARSRSASRSVGVVTPRGLARLAAPGDRGDFSDANVSVRRRARDEPRELESSNASDGDTSNAPSLCAPRCLRVFVIDTSSSFLSDSGVCSSADALARRRSSRRDGDGAGAGADLSLPEASSSIASCATAAAAAAAAVVLALDRALGGGDPGDRPAAGVVG